MRVIRAGSALVALLLAAPAAHAQFAPPPIVPPPAGCLGAPTFWVSASAPAAGADGTEAHPLRTIREALARGDSGIACHVTIRVADGTYAESLTISRRTSIIGSSLGATILRGSIVNHGQNLSLLELSIRDSPAPAAVQTDGGGTATLRRVAVSRAHAQAITQDGGSLSMTASTVEDTLARDGTTAGSFGIGVLVEGGGRATLNDVRISRSRGNGLAVRGAGSRAILRMTTIVDTLGRANAESLTNATRHRFAALSASDDAELFADHVGVARCDDHCLVVSDARANVRDSTFSAARESHENMSGDDAFFLDATVEISGVRTFSAERAGIRTQNTFIHASDVESDHNQVGVVVGHPAGFDVRCFSEHEVSVHDNDIVSQSVGLAAMGPPQGADAPPPECATVPWP